MEHVAIQCPARVHFGLIDMNGELGRIDGGVGLALEEPNTIIEATRSKEIRVSCRDEPGVVERLEASLQAVCDKYELPGASIDIKRRPLSHIGLGSATQTLVGIARAVCLLYDIKRPVPELAGLVGRGGTSGIGVGAIQAGGFIVDGGHSFRRGPGSKSTYTPSSASTAIKPPPILMRYDFPDWDVLITVPLGEGMSGLRELALFKVVCPVSVAEVQRMCHIILMQILPAVLEEDLELFAQAMQDYQQLGFKVFEFRSQAQSVLDCAQFLRDNGGMGVSMSSWGPTLIAFGKDLSKLRKDTDDWLDSHGGGKTYLTKANNVGMRVLQVDP